jgi:hypothetical protein
VTTTAQEKAKQLAAHARSREAQSDTRAELSELIPKAFPGIGPVEFAEMLESGLRDRDGDVLRSLRALAQHEAMAVWDKWEPPTA